MNSFDKQARIEHTDAIYRKSADAGAAAGELFAENVRLLRFLIPEHASVLDIGCGNGRILGSLKVRRGVGIDYSAAAIELARLANPHLEFHRADAEGEISLNETFDYVLFNLAVGDFLDVWKAFRNVRKFCRPETRVIVTYYNFIWDPLIRASTKLGLRRAWPEQNWFSIQDIETMLALNGFEILHDGTRTLFPLPIPGISHLCNRFLAHLPLFRHFNLLTYCVARPMAGDLARTPEQKSVSIIIPTRNEKGNVADAVARTPELGSHTELIFVDGDSSDGTVEEVEEQIETNRGKRDIKLIHQVPRNTEPESKKMLKLGKGDAVRKGFAAAQGDILIILDSDLTVPPEDMEKFYLALAENRAEFINGNRLSYPMEKQAMRFLNLVANRMFGILFTWLLGQSVKDTLCGTKALNKKAYEVIAENRGYFGDFDPFGDFDLLFGAAKQNLKIMDLPVRYRARTYGDIKIERFKHGMILLKMCWFAFKRFKIQ
ncbi:glycosyltransferase [Candidatus Sumerlaeota bacterium]|nr:glycosyltransferase [Candidatus Sumerlaeota bacterium]